jgi:hypothetical protein
VYLAGAWTSSGGFGNVLFDTKIFDTGGNFSTGTGLFTVPINGLYWLGGYAGVSSLAGGAAFGAGLNFTGSRGTITETHQVQIQGGTFGAGASANGFYQLEAGDTVGFGFYGSGATGSTGVTSNGFQGFLVSNA